MHRSQRLKNNSLVLQFSFSPLLSLAAPSLSAAILMGHILSHPVTSKNVQRLGDAHCRVGVGQLKRRRQRQKGGASASKEREAVESASARLPAGQGSGARRDSRKSADV